MWATLDEWQKICLSSFLECLSMRFEYVLQSGLIMKGCEAMIFEMRRTPNWIRVRSRYPKLDRLHWFSNFMSVIISQQHSFSCLKSKTLDEKKSLFRSHYSRVVVQAKFLIIGRTYIFWCPTFTWNMLQK